MNAVGRDDGQMVKSDWGQTGGRKATGHLSPQHLGLELHISGGLLPDNRTEPGIQQGGWTRNAANPKCF